MTWTLQLQWSDEQAEGSTFQGNAVRPVRQALVQAYVRWSGTGVGSKKFPSVSHTHLRRCCCCQVVE